MPCASPVGGEGKGGVLPKRGGKISSRKIPSQGTGGWGEKEPPKIELVLIKRITAVGGKLGEV